jgi:EAL domain-containing protein (putative c-di-GMP-specific phosphodiesterase class I)
LRTVCSQILAWLEAGKAAVPVAVNLSPLEFRQEKLAEIIAGIWQEYSLNQEFLELELRENALAENEMEAETTLRKLRAMGIKIVIDDFGTGYSSLSRLQRFNLNGVKIDKSFVSGSAEDKKDRALVGAIIAMAHALSLKVVAEGVENRQQLDALREMGCDRLQGYYLYEPVTAAEFTRLLNEKDGTNLPSDKANFPHLYSKEKAAAFLDS